MSASLVTVGREYFDSLAHEGLSFTVNEAFAKDNHYTLFRWQDWPAWVTFTVVFMALITFDSVVMNRKPGCLSIKTAIMYTLFWILCACGFAGWVYMYYGRSQAFMWMSGYMLEWMLSFDNLFVFHMIFNVYSTPDHLKHRPLYLGICGAIVFRLAFIFLGEFLMHAMFFMHFVFGFFLVYTGVKTATADEEDEDPSQHPLVQWLQAKVPFISAYDNEGRFFVRVKIDEKGEPIMPEGMLRLEGKSEADSINTAESESGYGTVASRSPQLDASGQPKTQLRATMLFLVLLCLETSDLLFAVDSVSAIVAQVNDLFLAYTSAVFAMLGLRAMFFIIDELAKAFTLLKYGVSAVLVFVGCKLIAARWFHVPPSLVCVLLVSCIGLSMLASVVKDRVALRAAEADLKAEALKLGKILTPLQSPYLKAVKPRAF
mmetsp:Transcript_38315/g.97215  ORF Transcript_38315/g.97215 Transcript_38315/m.97215 type:complete len:430 (+) Transcript_38315:60-1349(+)